MSTTEPSSFHPIIPSEPVVHETETMHISLTPHALNPLTATSFVATPHSGATVLFIGTTRSTFDSRAVSSLSYTSYTPLALSTLTSIATTLLAKHALFKIAIIHKLGECPVGQESILIAVSSKHRKEAWRAGEEALEEVKRRAEIWKLERFEGGEGVWRANRDGGLLGSLIIYITNHTA
ncbi:molybdenum cofactor synthesis protein-like protein 2 large subunit [Amniculicola lignicola CBS 123094]|uniref:Molybdopterin synthase catalytic subunit n=1 Tax=Amniculicola lignicola CBS 123094 TaxID=1392246 RepID=A0A6A5WED9_9PLEO|nr:molybdenum cofactor synthesis protein-like protein 2 large subunit [Amniculicola lignicola CBS 123094]